MKGRMLNGFLKLIFLSYLNNPECILYFFYEEVVFFFEFEERVNV